MAIKWYSKGKFTIDDTHQDENKLFIVKTEKSFTSDRKFSYDGYTYHIGYIDDDKIFLLENIISSTSPVIFSNIPERLKSYQSSTYTDIINIKLGNIRITTNHYKWDPSFKVWKYDDLVDIFSEEQIEFYK